MDKKEEKEEGKGDIKIRKGWQRIGDSRDGMIRLRTKRRGGKEMWIRLAFA